MKDTKDFKDFKHYFLHYQKLFGLTGYRVFFKYEPLEKRFAEILAYSQDATARVSLNSSLPKTERADLNIQQTAKHEAIHLLLTRLEDIARSRYVGSADVVTEAVEEVVVKLTELIP